MFDPKNLDSYLIKCYAEQLETFNSSLQRTPCYGLPVSSLINFLIWAKKANLHLQIKLVKIV